MYCVLPQLGYAALSGPAEIGTAIGAAPGAGHVAPVSGFRGGRTAMIHVSCARVLAEFEGLCARVLDERETVVIHCRHGRKVALIGAEELENLVKTAQMLRSPGSAARLVALLNRALEGGCDGG